MKFQKLSPAASDALQRIERPSSFLKVVIGNRSRKSASASHLQELLEEHDPARVVLIETQIRTLINDLVWKYSPDFWPKIRGPMPARFNPRKMKAKAFGFSQSDPGLALVLTTHHSGFVRETALDQISSFEGPFSLDLVLRRLNDWVPEVRTAAVRTIERCIFQSYEPAQDFACVVSGCLEMLLRFEEMGRSGAVESAIVGRLLLETGSLEKLKNIVLYSPLDRSIVLLKLALRRGMLSEMLSDLVCKGKHHAVRRTALKTILDEGFVWKTDKRLQRTIHDLDCDKDDLAEIGLSDHSADVQRVALQYVVSNPESRLHRESVFRPFVSSNNIGLADRAGFGMKRVLGPDKFHHCLVDQLQQSGTPPFWAARLIAKYGDTQDKALIRKVYERLSKRPDLSWLALLAAIEDQAAIEDLLEISLNHGDLRFARRAGAVLRGKVFQPDFEAVAAVIARGNAEFTRRGLARILEKCSTVNIVRAIALLSLHEPGTDLEGLWQLANQKRQLRAFFPKQHEVEQLERDIAIATPQIRTLAKLVLGPMDHNAD